MTSNKKLVKRLDKVGLYVVEGDITQIETDALMTAINSGGLWFGGIDGAVQRVSGNTYHAQAAAASPLSDLQTVVAKGDRNRHRGKFNDVVFVVDDLESPLDKVVYVGLEAANAEGYGRLLLPAIRMGVMAGVREKTPEETTYRLAKGVNDFVGKYGSQTKLGDITFVFYRDLDSMRRVESSLNLL